MKMANLLLTNVIFLSLSLGFTVGCGDKDDDSTPSPATGDTSDLVGTWSVCGTDDEGDPEKSMYAFSATDWTFTSSSHQATDCSGEALATMVRSGSFVGGAAVTTPEGAKTLDLTYVAVTLTPSSAAIASYLNAASMCGITTFAAGTATDLLGKDCGGGAITSGAVEPQIYKITGTTIQFGTDPENNDRSPALDTSITFTKQ